MRALAFKGRRTSRRLGTSLDASQKDAIHQALLRGIPRDKIAAKLGLTKSHVDLFFHSLTSTNESTSSQV